ncbi:polysaccharide pyruvyl transferase family protein [Geminicoccaceae bacterium 1502E]|nr:polysaccharide pyruvyl transferase family protein [Geminicoccaceae bacterium 1502E]
MMDVEPGRIGLFGLFGTGNMGNDGSLEAMTRFLARVAPDERPLCICADPGAVQAALGLEAVPIYGNSSRHRDSLAGRVAGRALLWAHAARYLRRLRLLIVPGTGVLDDFSVSPLGWPHDLLSWCLLARLLGVKVALVSIGAGPIHHPLSRWLMKRAARAAHYRSYRDAVSKSFMESIGFDTRNDPICPDIAFGLKPAEPCRGRGRPLTVGVGVMTYYGWRDDSSRGGAIYEAYLEKMTGYVAWLLDRGHAVRILMGDQVDRRAVADLLASVRACRPRLADPAMMFEPAHSLHDVMRQMAETDLVVVTRYHNLVCALGMGRPAISIGYAAKNDALMEEMGLAGYCQHIERLDQDLLQSQTMRLIADRAALETAVRDAGARFHARLQEQEKRLVALLDDGRPGRES